MYHHMKQLVPSLLPTLAQQYSTSIYEPDYLEVCCFVQWLW